MDTLFQEFQKVPSMMKGHIHIRPAMLQEKDVTCIYRYHRLIHLWHNYLDFVCI